MAETRPVLADAFRLFMEGAEVLSEIEQRGIRIDLRYCRRIQRQLLHRIEATREEIIASKEGRLWKKVYGESMKLNSTIQLESILFDHLGVESVGVTRTGRNSTDVESLSHIDNPLVEKLLRMRKLHKVINTYLHGIVRFTDDEGILHPAYSLSGVRTYRSSSQNPNFQNIPIRDPVVAE